MSTVACPHFADAFRRTASHTAVLPVPGPEVVVSLHTFAVAFTRPARAALRTYRTRTQHDGHHQSPGAFIGPITAEQVTLAVREAAE